MSPIQQMLLGAGAVATKTYVDDVFSTYLYKGNGSTTGDTQTINNGIDLAGEGGMVWLKSRDSGSYWHTVVDTVRGANKTVYPNDTFEEETLTNVVNSFNNNGFTAAYNSSYSGVFANKNNDNVASWTFRKAPGFLDIITWDGNQTGTSTRTLSHSLKSIPGMVIIKRTDGASNWWVYHTSLADDKILYLSETNGQDTGGYQYYQSVSSTGLTVGTELNESGRSYVGYIFAGGEDQTTATARSVDFDGTGDYLNTTSSSSNFTMGTGDFTVECWVKKDNITNAQGIFQISSTSGGLEGDPNYASTIAAAYGDHWHTYGAGSFNEDSSETPAKKGQWQHVALVRSSGTTKFYVDGEELISYTDTTNYNGTYIAIGGYYSTTYLMDGAISNFRVVKGTAVYTSSFRPPTKPLTSISGTVLLCCNNSSVTGSTVTPATLNSNGNPTASTDSPFDDPSGFVFGDAGDQNVIKCGSYVGNGSSSAPPEIYLGWEPQWVMVKRINGSGQDWVMVDSMRGMFSGLSQTPHFRANSSNAEQDTSYYRIDVSSGTGFAPFTTDNGLNGNGDEYIYIALRRPDGYVGKPPELGTGVFAMDTGNGSSTIPAFDSGFPVDFAFHRLTASPDDWFAGGRLMQGKKLTINDSSAEASNSAFVFDSNVGWGINHPSTKQGWGWKRSAGFDVVTYTGNATAGRQIPHSLGKTPEMIWCKNRDDPNNWEVYHKGLNGGSSPEDYFIRLNDNAAETNSTMWNDTAPTSTHFTIGAFDGVNRNTDAMIAMLFASVDGISKVGYYDGNNTSTPDTQTITTGFQPRFIMIKKRDGTGDWRVLDTVRGIPTGSTVDPALKLNSNAAQDSGYNLIDSISSTGFTLSNSGLVNYGEASFIYYAHA